MARPGLTIALLLTTPNLVDACQQWLPDTRYHSLNLSGPHQGQEQLDLVSTLEAQQVKTNMHPAFLFRLICCQDTLTMKMR